MAGVATAPVESFVESPRADRLFEAAGRTLEDLILLRWDEVVESGRAECPVCAGRLHAAGGCEGCGSELA